MPRRNLIVSLATAATLLFAGCGGSSGESKYRAAVKKICADNKSQTAKIPKPTTTAAVLPYLKQGLAITQADLARLQAVKPPSSLSKAHTAVVALLGQEVSGVGKVIGSIQKGISPVKAIKLTQPAFQAIRSQTDAQFGALGLPSCKSTAK